MLADFAAAASPASAAADGGAEQVLVEGVLCPAEHFNYPLQPYCRRCGASLAGDFRRAVWGPRPPVGVLARDDGAVYVLDRDYVVIDEYRAWPPAGHRAPLIVQSPLRERIHIEISLDGWSVRVTDLGSELPVGLSDPAGAGMAMAPGSCCLLEAGWRLVVGPRSLRFDSPLGRRS